MRLYLTLILFWAVGSRAALADFSADQLLTAVEDGTRKPPLISKIFSQKGKTRVEVQGTGRRSIRIARKDRLPHTLWTLDPDQRSYLEFKDKKQEPQKEFLGVDTLEGYLCNKYRVTLRGPAGPYTGLQWEAIDLDHSPIRQEYQKGNQLIVIELKNIVVHPLDPSLFEVPEGYRKLETAPP